jgi:hypothetical protein
MLVAAGIGLIGIGIVYLRWPTLFRRGIWMKTSIAIRLLTEESYRRYMRGLGWTSVALGSLLVLSGAFARTQQPIADIEQNDTARPPALPAQKGCELWRGTFSGNDPSVLVEARLCTDQEGHVSGLVQWSSLRSGYNVREVVGIRDTKGDFSLYDQGFREYRPKGQWVFCLIDRYTLTRDTPDKLTGRYSSRLCSDDAQVELHRVGEKNESEK